MCEIIAKVSVLGPFTILELILYKASQARQEENDSHGGRRYGFILTFL